MAQWDGIGDVQRWGEYYAGTRATPPVERLIDANSERTAWEWAAAIMTVDKARAARFAAYCQEHDIAKVVR